MKNNLLSLNEYRNNPEFYFCKGLRCANKKNIKEAYKNLQKALTLEPDNSEYKFNIACFLSELQRPKEANRIFNDILLNFNPDVYDSYFGMGCNSFEIGDIDKAAEYFEKYLYFDNEGEFSEEVSEMIFYLKFYYGISHDNRFVNRSADSLRKAKSYLYKNNLKNAIRELYKSIYSNPSNLQARNLLTLTLIRKQNYYRARYINDTVLDIDPKNCWANCLNLYILLHFRKISKLNKKADTIALVDIQSREDIICAVTTLFILNKIDQLILLLEVHIIEYCDSFLYSVLLLAYALTEITSKFNEVYNTLYTLEETNAEFIKWLENIREKFCVKNDKFSAIEEYNKIFALNNEDTNLKYYPEVYQGIYSDRRRVKPKTGSKNAPIIACALEHREIMYTRYYEQEIIEILNDCLQPEGEPVISKDIDTEAYSAALEYIYCRQYCIEMDKKELLQKYNVQLGTLNKAIKKLINK